MTIPAERPGTATAPTDLADEATAVGALGGRYELGLVIGRGGMSTVYQALDHHTGQQVAVKVFRPGVELADSPDRRRREVDLASTLTHPGIVAVLDAQVDDSDRVDGRAYLVTELVDGPTLGQRIALAPLSEHEAIELGAALCATLAYVHASGIIHRDIKPANVLLADGPDGLLRPKVTDFGIAVMIDSTRMTATGFLAGTANYLSPEQVLGQPVSAATDVYSLGLVLLEALTGTTVYAGHGIEAALARLNREPLPPAWISPALADLLANMTARNPAGRPSANTAQRAFRRLTGQGLVSDVFSIDFATAASRPARPSLLGTKRRRRGVAAACVTALALTGGLLFAIASNGGAATASNSDPSVSATVSRPSSGPTPSTTAAAASPAIGASAASGNPPAAAPAKYSAEASPPAPRTRAAAVAPQNNNGKGATKPKKKNQDGP